MIVQIGGGGREGTKKKPRNPEIKEIRLPSELSVKNQQILR